MYGAGDDEEEFEQFARYANNQDDTRDARDAREGKGQQTQTIQDQEEQQAAANEQYLQDQLNGSNLIALSAAERWFSANGVDPARVPTFSHNHVSKFSGYDQPPGSPDGKLTHNPSMNIPSSPSASQFSAVGIATARVELSREFTKMGRKLKTWEKGTFTSKLRAREKAPESKPPPCRNKSRFQYVIVLSED